MNPIDMEISNLSLFAILFTEDILRYVIGAGGIYLAINIAMAVRLAGRKIRDKNPPKGQITREILASLRTILIFSSVGLATLYGAKVGLFRVYFEMADYGMLYLVLTTLLLIVLHDGYFYWSHRFLHIRRVFKVAHRVHHRSNNPTPFTSFSFNFGEAAANAAFLPLVLLVLPLHPIALFMFTNHMMIRNAMGHSGYELFPAWRNHKPMFDWMTTVTHHDIHHARAGWNFGLYFTWWDRWMGTEYPTYHQKFAEVVQAKKTTAVTSPSGL